MTQPAMGPSRPQRSDRSLELVIRAINQQNRWSPDAYRSKRSLRGRLLGTVRRKGEIQELREATWRRTIPGSDVALELADVCYYLFQLRSAKATAVFKKLCSALGFTYQDIIGLAVRKYSSRATRGKDAEAEHSLLPQMVRSTDRAKRRAIPSLLMQLSSAIRLAPMATRKKPIRLLPTARSP